MVLATIRRTAISLPRCRLYLITPPVIQDYRLWVPTLESALDAGDVACLQIRLKNMDDDSMARVIDVLRPPAQKRGIAVLLNDHPELAFETGCDGVHIGQEDPPYAQARKAVGPDKIIGVTCHNSRHLAMDAGEKGADYVAFGSFYHTDTKEVEHHATPEILEWWSHVFTVPCVAIGGITVENARPLIKAGADFLAVSGGVWNHPDGPATAVAKFNKILGE